MHEQMTGECVCAPQTYSIQFGSFKERSGGDDVEESLEGEPILVWVTDNVVLSRRTLQKGKEGQFRKRGEKMFSTI